VYGGLIILAPGTAAISPNPSLWDVGFAATAWECALAVVPYSVMRPLFAGSETTLMHTWMHPWYRILLSDERTVMTNNSWAGGADYAQWLGIPPENKVWVESTFSLDRMVAEYERLYEHGFNRGQSNIAG
jgi:hypothetical protein